MKKKIGMKVRKYLNERLHEKHKKIFIGSTLR